MKHYLANCASLANGACGILACICAIAGFSELAMRLIFLAFFFDAIDGTLARAFGSTSWGGTLDRAADRISQGAAPALVFAQFFAWDLWAIATGCLFVFYGIIMFLRSGHSSFYFAGPPLSSIALLMLGIVMARPSEFVYLIGSMVCIASMLFQPRYPRRLVRDADKKRSPSLVAQLSGKTWVIRSVVLLALALSPVVFWKPIGLLLLGGALAYLLLGPLAYHLFPSARLGINMEEARL